MHDGALHELDFLRALRTRLESARHGQAGALVADAAARLGCSAQQVYTKLRGVGWSSGRKLRVDKGDTKVTPAEVFAVAGLIAASLRDNGKRLLAVDDAIEIALSNGLLRERVSPATMQRLMRLHACHPAELARATPHQDLRSLHPNHVWQLDASICVLYYLRSGGLAVMDEVQFNDNKPANVAKVADRRVIRYVVTDHCSGAFFVRYYLAAGESQALVFDFLMEAMAQAPNRVMHGVPWTLVWDKGAANMAHGIRALLHALSVRHWAHKTGNARAKGQSEVTHNLIERGFEGRLAMMKVEGIEHLNGCLDEWQRAYNASEVHTRHGQTRWAMWQTIRPEQLRVVPPLEVCRELLVAKPQTRVVKGNLTVQYTVKGHEPAVYSVAEIPGVRVGMELLVTANPYRAPAINVVTEDERGQTRYYVCDPIARDQFGFLVTAATIGEEFKRPIDTAVDTARKDLAEAAFGTRDLDDAAEAKRRGAVAFDGQVDPMRPVREQNASLPAHMRRKGTLMDVQNPVHTPTLHDHMAAERRRDGHSLDVPNQVRLEERPLDLVAALQQLKARLGRSPSVQEAQAVREWYPDGVPESDLDAIVQRLEQPAAADRPRLSIVR